MLLKPKISSQEDIEMKEDGQVNDKNEVEEDDIKKHLIEKENYREKMGR